MLQNNPLPVFLLLFLPACSLRAPRPPRARCRGCPRPFPQRDPGKEALPGALLPRSGLGLAPGAPRPCTDTSELPGKIELPRRCFRSACEFWGQVGCFPAPAGWFCYRGCRVCYGGETPPAISGGFWFPPLPAVPLAACRCRWAAARGWWGRHDGAGLSGAGGVQGAAKAPCLLPFPPSHPSAEPKEPQSLPEVLGHVGSTALRGWQRSSLLGGFWL